MEEQCLETIVGFALLVGLGLFHNLVLLLISRISSIAGLLFSLKAGPVAQVNDV